MISLNAIVEVNKQAGLPPDQWYEIASFTLGRNSLLHDVVINASKSNMHVGVPPNSSIDTDLDPRFLIASDWHYCDVPFVEKLADTYLERCKKANSGDASKRVVYLVLLLVSYCACIVEMWKETGVAFNARVVFYYT